MYIRLAASNRVARRTAPPRGGVVELKEPRASLPCTFEIPMGFSLKVSFLGSEAVEHREAASLEDQLLRLGGRETGGDLPPCVTLS